MKAFKKILKTNVVWAAVAAAILFAAWQLAYVGIKNQYILPGIGQTFAAFFALFAESSFYLALGNTLLRTAISFVVSFAAAAVFAAVSAVCRQFKVVCSCLISVVRTLPTMAVTLMLLIWSTPQVAPAIVTALVLFPMVYSQFMAAIEGIDKNLLEMAEVYRISRRDKLTKIILPAVAPEVISQVGAGLSLGIKVMVSAEVLSYTLHSLGGMMQQANLYFLIPRFAALTLVCVLIGLIMEMLSLGLKMLVGRWAIKEGANAD